jgi:hypothetical protein
MSKKTISRYCPFKIINMMTLGVFAGKLYDVLIFLLSSVLYIFLASAHTVINLAQNPVQILKRAKIRS